MRSTIKKDKAVIEKFEEYNIPIDVIDSVPICFCELDVSAKTKDKKIYLNQSMLSRDNAFEFATPYLSHEIVHVLQQITGKNLSKDKADDYLDKPTEMEAFETQVDFKKRHEGEDSAEEYVDHLLDYHDINGKERREKEKKLLDE
ncbi:MAG: hypothetical protein WC523_00640 [Patescibacteria group bacterium]